MNEEQNKKLEDRVAIAFSNTNKWLGRNNFKAEDLGRKNMTEQSIKEQINKALSRGEYLEDALFIVTRVNMVELPSKLMNDRKSISEIITKVQCHAREVHSQLGSTKIHDLVLNRILIKIPSKVECYYDRRTQSFVLHNANECQVANYWEKSFQCVQDRDAWLAHNRYEGNENYPTMWKKKSKKLI